MRAGQVTNLLIMDSNPVFTAPATWGFAKALKRVPFSLALARARRRDRAGDQLVRADGASVGELERRARL